MLADGRAWDVASITIGRLLAAQGELPTPPRLQGEFTVVDLRNGAGEVATLDGSDPERVHWSVGRSVALSELALSGLKEDSEKTLTGRSLQCPSCGNAITLTLTATQSVACSQCAAVVDIGSGIGADQKHCAQANAGVAGAEPQIPLGRTGTLAFDGAPLPWQVVGYLERCDIFKDSEDETSFWREYLLFNRGAGFAFLVDNNEGWSGVRPITGAPAVRGDTATWQGLPYKKRWAYGARVTWVQGEFYRRVQQGERAHVTDYEGQGAAANKRLSREQAGNEVTWPAGETMSAAQVAEAFAIEPGARAALQRDAAPVSTAGAGVAEVVFIVFALFVLAIILSTCSGDDCNDVRRTFGAASTEYQHCQRNAGSGFRGGGVGGCSCGGWTSGSGGHK